jgi:hypothetical protein
MKWLFLHKEIFFVVLGIENANFTHINIYLYIFIFVYVFFLM